MHKKSPYIVVLEMRQWSLLTSPVPPPPSSLCTDSQISTVASFEIAQREENGQSGARRNSIICCDADREWYQWFNYLIWACDTHLNIFSLPLSTGAPLGFSTHGAAIAAMGSRADYQSSSKYTHTCTCTCHTHLKHREHLQNAHKRTHTHAQSL